MKLLDQYQDLLFRKQKRTYSDNDRLFAMGNTIVDIWNNIFNADPGAAVNDVIIHKLAFIYDALTLQLDRQTAEHKVEMERISVVLCSAYSWSAEMSSMLSAVVIDSQLFGNLDTLLTRRFWQLNNNYLSESEKTEINMIAGVLGKPIQREHSITSGGGWRSGWFADATDSGSVVAAPRNKPSRTVKKQAAKKGHISRNQIGLF